MVDYEPPAKPSSRRGEKKSESRESSRRSSGHHHHRSSKSNSRSSSSKKDEEEVKPRSSRGRRRSEKDEETTTTATTTSTADSEAKRQAKEMQGPINPGGVAVGVPVGAQPVGPSDKKAASECKKKDSQRRSSSTATKDNQDGKDKESKKRSSRSTKHPMQPGAVSSSRGSESTINRTKPSSSSSRTSTRRSRGNGSEDRDMQNAAKARVGAHRSSNRRSSARHENQSEVVEDAAGDNSNNNDAYEIQAELVENNDNDQDEELNRRENSRMQMQIQEENGRLRREMADENERLRLEMQAMKQKAEADKKKKKKRNCIILVVVLILIGGGVGAFVATQGGNSSNANIPDDVPPAVNETDPTKDLVVTTPSPSTLPSLSPTVFFTYPPPNQEDCDAVAQQLPVEGEEDMKVLGYAVDMEAILSSEIEPETVRSDVEAKLRSVFIPSLVGCTDAERRQLRGRDHRKLVNELQFAVANGKVTVTLSDDGVCESETTLPCYILEVTLELFIKGNEKIFDIRAIIVEFLQRSDLVEFLALIEPTQRLVMKNIDSTDKTDPPSSSPTGIPSSPPSMAPSSSPSTSPPTDEPSTNPTRMPVVGATPDPTSVPVPDPTPSPTVTPLTPAPTCPGVAAYFDSETFTQHRGSQDARFNVACTASSDLVALVYNSDTCAVECAASLPSSSYSQSCSESNQVRFVLSGNFQNENVLIGFRRNSNTLTCGANMILITDAPTAAPFPGSTPIPTITASSLPTLFPTSGPTNAPTAGPTNTPTSGPTSAPTDTPTQSPTSVPTSQPTDVPNDPPTSGPSPVPTRAPTSGPTSGPTPVSRRNFYEALLVGNPVDASILNWLIGDSWVCDREDSRHDEEVLERLDLALLYKTARGAFWDTNTNWMSSQHHCDWYGIACSRDMFVTEINLNGNNLVGSIPTEIGRFGNLVYLKMNQNDFDSTSQGLPSELSQLTQLTHLDISVSKLQGTIPALEDMVNLEYLNLRRNNLGGSLPVLPHKFSGSDCANCLLQKNDFSNYGNADNKNCKVEVCIGAIGCSTVCLNGSAPPLSGLGGSGGWPF